MPYVSEVRAREMLDSRGRPTVEAEMITRSGMVGRAIVPSGTSAGTRAAAELRDGDPRRYAGEGVLNAVGNLLGPIAEAVRGLNVTQQAGFNRALVDLDGTEAKSKLGVNAILAASMAAARAGALYMNVPLYRYIGGLRANVLPVPMMNVLTGGRHADSKVDFQEFMIVPVAGGSFSEALRVGVEVFYAIEEVLAEKGHRTTVGDEGSFAPELKANEQAIDIVLAGIERAGYAPGIDVHLALDPAGSELFKDGAYVLEGGGGRRLDSAEMVAFYVDWVDRYPIVSIEDGMAAGDHEGWKLMTDTLGDRIQLVGDDLFVSNPRILADGVRGGLANAVLVKLNQIGTVSETLETLELAWRTGYGAVISHGSGETEDTFVADLAVASGCGQIEAGSVCRSDRTAKYNQLLRIEEELATRAHFPGLDALRRSWRGTPETPAES